MSPSNRALTILAPSRRTLTLVLAISALTILLAISILAVTGAERRRWRLRCRVAFQARVTNRRRPGGEWLIKPEIAAANNGVIDVIGSASVYTNRPAPTQAPDHTPLRA